jgi:death-on-curing protein
MRYLTLAEVVQLHLLLAEATGGASGIRDLATLESAVAQPKATFDKNDLYPSLTDKAAILCFSIVQGHPFVDGNKRTGHAAMATFLLLNGFEIDATVDEQEKVMLALASGQIDRPKFAEWLDQHVKTTAGFEGV